MSGRQIGEERERERVREREMNRLIDTHTHTHAYAHTHTYTPIYMFFKHRPNIYDQNESNISHTDS